MPLGFMLSLTLKWMIVERALKRGSVPLHLQFTHGPALWLSSYNKFGFVILNCNSIVVTLWDLKLSGWFAVFISFYMFSSLCSSIYCSFHILFSFVSGSIWRRLHARWWDEVENFAPNAKAQFSHRVCMGCRQQFHCHRGWHNFKASCDQKDGSGWRSVPVSFR